MSRALTLTDVLEEVRRQGADPDSVRVYASGQPLDVDGEWCVDRRDGGPALVLAYEFEDGDCDCLECPDPDAHVKAPADRTGAKS